MKIVISQPRYLPALNYLSRLYFSDYFVLLDNVQRQSRGFENRNKLFLPSVKWLSVPISSSNREVLFETKINDSNWVSEHKHIIHNMYEKHPFYDPNILDEWYKNVELETYFVNSMRVYLTNVCRSLNFTPNIILSTVVTGRERQTGAENLVNIVKNIDSNAVYVSGSNGREYGIKKLFCKNGLSVLFHDWIPEPYPQKGQNNFTSFLAFPDMVFNQGLGAVEELVKKEQELNAK